MDKYKDDKYTKDLYNWKKENNKLNSKIKESENLRKKMLFLWNERKLLVKHFSCQISESVHQWLRKVEDASESAINNVFNPKTSANSKSNSNLSKQTKLNDDPYSGTNKLHFYR